MRAWRYAAILTVMSCERRNDPASTAGEPPWLSATTSISVDVGKSRTEESVDVRIDAHGVSLRTQRGWAKATLDEVSQRLEEKKRGDSYKDGIIASRPTVAIEVAWDTPWCKVLSVVRLCEVWFHRRVVVDIGEQEIAIYLPFNSSRMYPPIPVGALVRMRVNFRLAADKELPQGTSIVVDGRVCDLRSLRSRLGELSRHISQRPAVAVLDIHPNVPAGDVAALFRTLIEADIRWYDEKSPEPPEDD